MPLDPGIPAKERIGFLNACFVEGDAEQRTRERRVRRRALALSVSVQTIFLAALLIVPLLAKTPPPATEIVPVPPYFHSAAHEQRAIEQRRRSAQPPPCRFCPPTHIPLSVHVLPPEDVAAPPGDFIAVGQGQGPGSGIRDLNVFDTRPQPQAPALPQQHRIRQGGRVQAAMLVYRAEPVYPTLMRQIRKSGRVELRAIISTDGTVHSLQVISGDPGFFQSALDAVRQWRYKPTVLNGQPVEVETSITVIYNIN